MTRVGSFCDLNLKYTKEDMMDVSDRSSQKTTTNEGSAISDPVRDLSLSVAGLLVEREDSCLVIVKRL